MISAPLVEHGAADRSAADTTPVHAEADSAIEASDAATPTSALQLQTELRRLQAEVAELRQAKAEVERLREVDSQLSRFQERMRWSVDQTLTSWSENILDALVPYLEGLNAALYLLERDRNPPELRLIGGYALPQEIRDTIQLGEGITGQVARNARPVLIDNPKIFRAATDSSLTKIEAGAFVVHPLVHDDAVEGVLEIALLRPLSAQQDLLLRQLCNLIAANLGTIRAQDRIGRLLHEAQEQREMLLAQEEEMRQNVEELEATQEEMKRVSQELQLSDGRFRRIAGHISGMMFQYVVDVETGLQGFAFVSEQAQQYLGRNASLISGVMSRAFPFPAHPDDAAQLEAAFTAATQHLSPVREVFRLQAGEEALWVRLEAAPNRESDGRVVWDGMLFDIHQVKLQELEIQTMNEELTSREEEMRQNLEELEATQEQMRHVQQEVEEQKAYLGAIIDSSDASVTLYDDRYIIRVTNKAIRDRYAARGISIREGQSAFESFDASIHAEWKGYYDRALTGEAFKIIKERDDPDGRKYIEYDFRPVANEDGKVRLFALFSRDVTRFKEMEIALQANDVRLKQLASNAPVVLYQYRVDIAAQEHAFTFVSDTVTDLLGYRPAEFLSFGAEGFAERIHPQDLKVFRELYQASVAARSAFDAIFRFRRADGDYLQVRMRSNPRVVSESLVESDGIILLD